MTQWVLNLDIVFSCSNPSQQLWTGSDSPKKLYPNFHVAAKVLFLSILLWSGAIRAENFPRSSLYELPLAWENETGESFGLSKFSGKPVVLSLIYTSCDAVCPLIVSKVKKIYNAARSHNAYFVLVTMDPEVDTPEKLKEFKIKNKVDFKNWYFLRTNTGDTRKFSQVLSFSYKKMQGSGHFVHDNKIFLLNEKGIVIEALVGITTSEKPIVDFISKPTLWKKIKKTFGY